ncbi:hypothetical protein PPACK8108_LOCUS16604 [Phakopsora pachyrhizi]|uniref:Tc1-like transposase DDE domain-containing protein n=1 Tax=Phakopsora pachyrhizi TaxID=170000 RepID=A0AAV0BDA0_PHAPC|nr:hypothetical protein PPACK8108_LOCUS16604 [Phakopsora pachyrhizi]
MMIWGCFQGLKMGPMVILPKGCQNAQSFINNVYKPPAQSPDLNTIEHLWKIMKTTIGRFYQPKNLTELTEAIHKAWTSMPGQMAEVIASKGGHTHY